MSVWNDSPFYLIVLFVALVFIQGTKEKRVCLGFLEEKAKQVWQLIFLISFWHYSKCSHLKDRYFLMENKNPLSMLNFILLGYRKGKKVTFLFICWWLSKPWGRGWWHIPSWAYLFRGGKPAQQEAALILLDLEENPPWPQQQDCVSMPYIPPASQPCTGQQFARSKLARCKKAP